MANRSKSTECLTPVKDTNEWSEALKFPGLLVVEIYSSWFGMCEVMLPTIQSIMQTLPDADEKIKWVAINVAKIQDDIRSSKHEEMRKKQEMETVKKRLEAVDGVVESGKAGVEGGSGEDDVNGGQDGNRPSDESESNNTSENSNLSSIPCLEKYSGFCHPMPLYLFFKDQKVVEELRGANPPRLTEMVKLCTSKRSAPVEPEDPLPINRMARRGSMSLYAPDETTEGAIAEAIAAAKETAEKRNNNSSEDENEDEAEERDKDPTSTENEAEADVDVNEKAEKISPSENDPVAVDS